MENEKDTSEPILPNDANSPQDESLPQRGGCLTTLLVLMMIGNAFTIILYLVMGDEISRKAHVPEFTPYLMSFFGVLNIVFAYLIWNWKKSGVIGIGINSAIILVVNLMLGLGISSFGGLIGAVILIALVNPHWKHFE